MTCLFDTFIAYQEYGAERLAEVVSVRPPQRAEGNRPPGRAEIYHCFYMAFLHLHILLDFGKILGVFGDQYSLNIFTTEREASLLGGRRYIKTFIWDFWIPIFT